MRSRLRVLVAEDDAGVRDLIRMRLEMAGYDVHTARNGVECLQRLSDLRPQALVLDINMPQMDGFAVLENLQARRTRPATLVLTARHAVDDVKRALKLGAKDYLTKPFTEGQLSARVSRLMRAAEADAARTVVVEV